MFKPIVKKVKVGAISKDLLAIAAEKGVGVEFLDFEIIKINTYYKIIQKTAWKQVPKEQLAKLFEEKTLINHTVLITQDYHIKIFHKDTQQTTFKPIIVFGANKQKTLAKVVVKSESKFGKIDSKFQINLYHEINKKKLRAGIMIGVMDRELIVGIKKLLQQIVQDKGLKKDFEMIAARGLNQINGTEDNAELLYLQKKSNTERNYVDPVEKDELIITYTKATPATCGRSCDGSVIYPEKIKLAYPGGIKHDETIYKEEEEKVVNFYAQKGGYVVENNGNFGIKNEVSLKEASFKGSGSIVGGEDKSISVNISESDSSVDAISSGVKLDVANVDVAGSVGGNTKISAEAVKIGSQTHRNSVIEAGDKAEVHLHRGNLKTKEADVNILETGKITANIARVKKAVGGEIFAKEVYIDELSSNVKIVASVSVNIKMITGQNNKIRISAEASDDSSKLENIKEQIKLLKESIDEMIENKKVISKKLVDEEPRRKKFQKQLIDFKKAGRKPPVATMAKVREYLRYEEEIKNFDKDVEEVNHKIKTLEDEMHEVAKEAFNAVVNCDGSWDGQTEIVFIHPETSQEFRLVPNSHETNIKLQDLGEGKASITFD